MGNGITSVDDERLGQDSEFRDDEFIAQRKKNKHQNILFFGIAIISLILMIIAVYLSYVTLEGNPTTQKVAILVLMITAPIILILALMRYTYKGKESDNPQPTLMLNIGREFSSVLKEIFIR